MTADPHSQDERTSILVVEDDAIARTLLDIQLNQLGFQVSEAASARQALALLQRYRFALALIDLQIPGLPGAALLERSRRTSPLNRDLRAIAISVRIDPEQKQRLRQAGFVAWLRKPITLEQLRQAVQAWLPDHSTRPVPRNETNQEGTDLFDPIQETLQAKFLSDLPTQLETIENALNHRQRQQVLEAVHQLHGAAGFCRFETLQRWAARMENALRRKDGEECAALWRHLKREAEGLLTQGLDTGANQT